MRRLCALLLCLTLSGCDLDGLRSLTTAPAARFQIVQELTANSGSQVLCGPDTTGLLDASYEGLAEDVLVIGHRTTGADSRCRRDVPRRSHGYVGFDLSEIGRPDPTAAGARQVTSALLSARIRPVPDFDGGGIGCRTSLSGLGMLDNVFALPRQEFFPAAPPDLSNPPQTTRVTGFIVRDRRVSFNSFLLSANDPFDVVGASRGAMTLSLDARGLARLQRLVNDNSAGLRQFGVYFVGTGSGSTGTNQTCVQHFEDIQLVVFYRDVP